MASPEIAHGLCTRALAHTARAGASRGAAPYWLLVALTAVGPASFQIFLPSLPAIRDGFGVATGTAQLALSLSMGGIAVATLAYGSLADRWGRRPTLLAGMALMLLGSLLCATAPSIGVLILGRIVQAAGGAAGMVVTRAIVLDMYGRDGARHVMANLLAAMMIAPMLATPVGGFLSDAASWRVTFAVTAAAAGASLLAVLFLLPETGGRAAEGAREGVLASYRRLLSSPSFDGFAFQGAFAMAAFMAFSTGAPYALGGELGLSASRMGLVFVVVSLGFAAGSLAAGRLPDGIDDARRVRWGGLAALGAALLGLGFAVTGVWTVPALVGPAMLFAAAVGITLPASQTGAISAEPGLSGAASGLSGFLGTAVGAATAQVGGVLSDGTPLPVAGLMAGMAALSVAAALLLRRPAPR